MMRGPDGSYKRPRKCDECGGLIRWAWWDGRYDGWKITKANGRDGMRCHSCEARAAEREDARDD